MSEHQVQPSAEPTPGLLASLGADVDRDDAGDLIDVVRALSRHQRRAGRFAVNKAAREALWWTWEQRRLPRPLVRGKYPGPYPWSPGARAALEQVRESGLSDHRVSGLVIEHLVPARITMARALDQAADLDVDTFLPILRQHGAAAVITREEDVLLAAAGLTSKMPDSWDGADLWARPRAAGLDPATFAPIQVMGSHSLLTAEDHVAAGHSGEKVALAWELANLIEATTGWTISVKKNQITFRDGPRTPIRVQFWGQRVRLELGYPTDPADNPLAPNTPLQGKTGRCYWFVDSPAQVPADLSAVLALVGF